ncbi:MAG: hypothetical protein IH595_03825 [Bacteroidales bacterium]|nr:hypothetical protein [Bacteroidales bacterium]
MKTLQLTILFFLLRGYAEAQNTNYEKVLHGHKSTVLSRDNDKGGKYLCPGSYDTDVIRSIDFSSDDKFLASAGEDNLINLWNAMTGELMATFTEDNNKELISVLFSHDDKYLITGSQDKTIKYWNISNLINNK